MDCVEISSLIFLSLVLGITKGIQDKLLFHFDTSVFQRLGNWWNPKESWKNKWKDGDKSKGERFFLSSTWLVSLTDAWHFFGLIRNFSIFLIIALIVDWKFIFFYFLFVGTFHLFFTYVFKKVK
jgi:disulfide bond formation protein DsbB